MEIVLDANALVYAVKYKIDIIKAIREKFGLIGVYVPNLVLNELKQMSKSAEKAADRDAAWLAYQIATKQKITEIRLSGVTDEAIMAYALGHKAMVLTNDSILRFRLKEAGITVYSIRQKKLIAEV